MFSAEVAVHEYRLEATVGEPLVLGAEILAVVIAALVLLAELPSQSDVPYVVFPVLIWAALRFGPRGASTALVVVSGLTVWNTAHNAGPFVRQSITDSLLSSQLFLADAKPGSAAWSMPTLSASSSSRSSARWRKHT